MNRRDLGEEIDHLLGFGWTAERIADRLGCHQSTVEKRVTRARLAELASAETAYVFAHSSTERGQYGGAA